MFKSSCSVMYAWSNNQINSGIINILMHYCSSLLVWYCIWLYVYNACLNLQIQQMLVSSSAIDYSKTFSNTYGMLMIWITLILLDSFHYYKFIIASYLIKLFDWRWSVLLNELRFICVELRQTSFVPAPIRGKIKICFIYN